MFFLKPNRNMYNYKSRRAPFLLFYKHKKLNIFKKLTKLKPKLMLKKRHNSRGFLCQKNVNYYKNLLFDSFTLSIGGLKYNNFNQVIRYSFISGLIIPDRHKIYQLRYCFSVPQGTLFFSVFNFKNGKVVYTASGGLFVYYEGTDWDKAVSYFFYPSGEVLKTTFLSVGFIGRNSGIYSKFRVFSLFRYKKKNKKK